MGIRSPLTRYKRPVGDLYTMAFKNLSSLFLPIVLGMFATTLFFDEHKNDTLKELLIIPITKVQLYFSKVAVMILMSVGLCLITFLLCVVGGSPLNRKRPQQQRQGQNTPDNLIPLPFLHFSCNDCHAVSSFRGSHYKGRTLP